MHVISWLNPKRLYTANDVTIIDITSSVSTTHLQLDNGWTDSSNACETKCWL